MEKIKALWEDKRITLLALLVASGMVILFYWRKIPLIYTVWELVDEYGYLANAAYLSGVEWNPMINLYYGYGYSFLLVPLFWIFDTGIEIIRGAIFVNALCVVGLLWVQYLLMTKIFNRINRNAIVGISFAFCFFPYIVSSALKVIPECLLTLMIWVCGFLLYQAVDTGKRRYYILLAVALVYTFFVHTRTVVFCVVLIGVVGILCVKKQIDTKNLVLFLIICAVAFFAGTMLKNQVIDAVYSRLLFAEEATEVGNTLSIASIWEKLVELLVDFSVLHINSLSAKLFYIFVSTAGMAFIGFYSAIKDGVKQLGTGQRVDIKAIISVLYAVSMLMMAIALVVNPMGQTEGTGHYFYARYYEYLIAPVAFLGVCNCLEKKLSIKEVLGSIAVFFAVSWFTLDLAGYLHTQEFYYDSNRMPAFSYIMNTRHLFEDVIKACVIFALMAFVVVNILGHIKWMKYSVVIVMFLFFKLNNNVNVDGIIGIHSRNMVLHSFAEYIHGNYDVEEVYFLNGDEPIYTAYTGMQALLGPEKLNVIEVGDLEQIESGDLVMTFYHNPYIEQIDREKTWLMEMGTYELWVVD